MAAAAATRSRRHRQHRAPISFRPREQLHTPVAQSEVIMTQSESLRMQSEVISREPLNTPVAQSEVIMTQSEAIRISSAVLSGHGDPRDAIRGHHDAIRVPPDAIRGHQRACAARRSSSETRRKSRWRSERPSPRIACRYDASDATGFPSRASSSNPEAACTLETLASHQDTISARSRRSCHQQYASSTQAGRNQDAVMTQS